METVRASVICIIFAGIIGSIAMVFMPGRGKNMVMKAIVSIFIILSLFEPMKKTLDCFDCFSFVQNEQPVYVYDSQMVADYVREEIDKVVEEKAKEYNIEISSVEAEIKEEEDCIIIQKIIVKASEDDKDKLDEFEKSVSAAAGVEITAETK